LNEKDAKVLLKKYRAGTLTEEERIILESWYLELAASKESPKITQEDLQRDLKNISKGLPGFKKAEPSLSPYVRSLLIAASVLLFISISIVFYLNREGPPLITQKVTNGYLNEIAPGGNKAVLTLADNSQVLLDSNSSTLSYKLNGEKNSSNVTVQYNTISTPKGGEFKLELSDGTMVWLNAMSSIRFPTSFIGDSRKVEVVGEAYFEVAKNAEMPFFVKSDKQIIEVLGTHFNINAYHDEQSVKTTLLEGSVKVYTHDKSASKFLKPGQQSEIFENENLFNVSNIDTETAVAWKNGYFRFVDEDLKSIMGKLSRWYNVDIEYQNVDPKLKFGGVISRSRNLSQVLKLLELTGNVKFKVDERRIIVMP